MPTPSWQDYADLALKRLASSGAEYGDIRIVHSTSQTIRGEDRRVASVREAEDTGFGVRVLYHGAWGFAASSIISLEEVPRVTDLAVEIAKGSASIAVDKVAKRYNEALKDVAIVPEVPEGLTSVWAQYTIRLKPGQRDRFAISLKAQGVPQGFGERIAARGGAPCALSRSPRAPRGPRR